MQYSGLSSIEVQERKEKGLINFSVEHKTRTKKEIVLKNIFTYFNFINLFLFILVCITGSFHNGAFFLTIIFNDCICIFQELKAKRILDKMSLFVIQDINTLRDSSWIKIKANELVLDDVIELHSGMQVPTDAEIIDGYLEVNESILTGESETCIKRKQDLVLAGTIVTSSSAIARVIHVGKDNFSESIMNDAKKYKQATSILNKEINLLLKKISILIIPIGLLLFVSQINSDLSRNEAILKTVSAIIGMIPEGVIVLISLALTISTIRLSHKGVLVQDLNSIETLARVDTLCIDKTGTVTKGSLKVVDLKIINSDVSEINQILGTYVHLFKNGNSTDIALQNYFKEIDTTNVTNILPFSSEKKFAGFEVNHTSSFYIGAYSFLFHKQDQEISDFIHQYASKGQRVLVLAEASQALTEHPTNLKLLGCIILEDELRDNIQELMNFFEQNDVQIKIISGDQVETVQTLSKLAGVNNSNYCIDMTQCNDELENVVESNVVFGRVLPKQKKELVEALRKKGHTVAMIGDGVNDVLALKKADVSISLNDASSAAKNSSNIVLLSNDFGVVPDIIYEGRRVINNISRGATMYFVKTGFSLFLSIYVILFHENYPFLPIHLTLIGMFSVALPTFFLQFEPSFERVKQSFVQQALYKAIPSSLTVCLFVIISNYVADYFKLSTNELHTIVVFTTFLVYSYTLKRVYSPFNKIRIFILIVMVVGMLLSMILLPNLFQLDFSLKNIIILTVLSLFIPIMVNFFQNIIHHFKEIG